jgi:hypothetical protein
MYNEGASVPFSFFSRRWRRQVPLGTLFWRDMIVVGSVINLAAAFVALMALGLKAGLMVTILIFHAPLPYNIFLVASVWRAADIADPKTASSARFGAAIWLAVATLL